MNARALGMGAMLVIAVPAAAQADTNEAEIVVTATRSERRLEDVPAAITVQDIAALRAGGFTYGTDEFRGVPGVSFRRGEGDGDFFPFVSIRGSTGTDGFLALVDGVPFVGVFEEPLLAEVPYDALKRVEIVKGPLSALYGRGAIYGGVNYITRDPDRDAITGTLASGSDDYYRGSATITRSFSGGGVLVGGAYENFRGWREQSRREVGSAFAKLNLDVGEATRLSLFGNYLNRRIEVPNGLPVDGQGNVLAERQPFLGLGEPYESIEGGIAALIVKHDLSDAVTVKLTGQHRRFDRDNFLNFYDAFGLDQSRGVFGVNGYRGDTGQRVWYGEASMSARFGAHSLIAGVTYEDTRNRSLARWSGQNGFTPECGFTFYLAEIDIRTGAVANRNNPCFVIDEPLTSASFHDRFFGAFIQDEIALADRLTLTVGGRYDSFRRRSDFDALPASGPGGTARLRADAFSPKASVSWRTGFGQVYASYGRGFNSNFGATFENDPAQYFRPELKPTTIDAAELGVKGRALGGTLRFEGAIYRTWQKNRRTIIPNPDAATSFSVPPNLVTFGQRYDVQGAEVALDIVPRDGTRFRLQYSHVDPKWDELVLSTFSGPLDLSGTTPVGVARNIVFASAEQRIASWLTARGAVEFYDDYAVTTNNSLFAGAYEVVSLGTTIAPPSWRGIALDLSATNLLDREYYFYFGGTSAPTYATPGPPRQLRATLRASF
ncbi:TonB-dependent receptor [Novosphingobium sp. ERN07]|uniref:TonB-dependent receptor n=1 Tax=Novosphingobium sp. ERN07 TaxID=2726187 RepID=UPI001456F01C|nr:TonB-dependent receptor [Novosphingobium sp. ERN07]NLR73379.1 TonB-dependent receptor [Novosphingobium sp. ERN07]